MFPHTTAALERLQYHIDIATQQRSEVDLEDVRLELCDAYLRDVGPKVSQADVYRYCTIEFLQSQVRRYGGKKPLPKAMYSASPKQWLPVPHHQYLPDAEVDRYIAYLEMESKP